MYLRVFSFDFSPQNLVSKIAEDPAFFTQLVFWAYGKKDERKQEKSSEEVVKQRAEIAWELLRKASRLPGQKGKQVDKIFLNEWLDTARNIFEKNDCKKLGDKLLGEYLSNCPMGEDGIWPHEAIREVVERIKSRELDQGLKIGKRNLRGMTSKHPYAGGDQERKLAHKYFYDATTLQLISPRTADILKQIAKSYEYDANREDIEAEIREW